MQKKQLTTMRIGIIGLLIISVLFSCRKKNIPKIFNPPEGFMYIPASTNAMVGNSADKDPYMQPDEGPEHTLVLKDFFLSKYEVTVGEFKKFVAAGYNYDTVANMPTWDNGLKGWLSDKHPMVFVSWKDAAYYCNWLSELEGLQPCYMFTGMKIKCDFDRNGYRLPTEAEWEYACRAGQTKPYTVGNQGRDTLLPTEANYGNIIGTTTPVDSYTPNGFGLYNMHGNVWEWCYDFYDSAYYSKPESGIPNATGPSTGNTHVFRGGWWHNKVQDTRSANRYYAEDNYRGYDVGFRVARNAQ